MLDKKKLWEVRGLKLESMRKQLGLSADQVAVGIGVSENRIKRLEKGLPVNDGFMMERTYIYFLELLKRGVCPYSVCHDFDKGFGKYVGVNGKC